VELSIVDKKYTWYKANESAKTILDKVFIYEEWLKKWPMSKQHIQLRVVSENCTIVVKSMVKDWGLKPFRTIDAWLLEHGFKVWVNDKWKSYLV